MLHISVVIPAYNAEKLIRKAVESAHKFQEVNEILLVEDGSTDNTLNVCRQLQKEFEKVKLYSHSNNRNKGAGESRSLGIKKASCEYVAFLDADDYYLPNRFDAEKTILDKDTNIDGVYGAVGVHYYSDVGKEKFRKMYKDELTTITTKVSSKDLKYILLGMSKNYNGSGFFHLDSLTVRKKLLEKIGFFNDKLRLHQDSDLIIKLAFMGSLVPGVIDVPIAIRGLHDNNRITSTLSGLNSRYLFFSELEQWVNINVIGEEKAKRCIRKDRLVYQLLIEKNKLTKIWHLIRLFHNEKYLLFVDKEFNRVTKGIFGNIFLLKVLIRFKNIIFHLVFKERINRWNDYLNI